MKAKKRQLMSPSVRNKYTCLQLTNSAIRRVDMRVTAGRAVPVHTAAQTIPDPGKGPMALVETVCQLFNERRAQHPVFVSLSSNEVLLKKGELPSAVPNADAEKQAAAISTALEHENVIPVSLNQVAYDFHLFNATTVLVGWMRRGELLVLNKHLAESGIKLVFLTPQPVVLANQLLSEWGDERVCGIHIDGGTGDMVVIEAGEVCLGRSFAFHTPDELLATVHQTLANTEAVSQIILYYSANAPEPQIELLFARDEYEVTTATFDWAPSLLMPQVTENGIAINLLAPIRATQAAAQRQQRKQRLWKWAPIAIVLALLCANVMLLYQVEANKDRLNAANREQAQIQMYRNKTESLQQQYTDLNSALKTLKWGERRHTPLETRLITVAQKIPATIRLTAIKTPPLPRATTDYVAFDARKTLRLEGEANAQTDIDAFRIALLTQPLFLSVRQVATEQIARAGEQRLAFTLELTSKGVNHTNDANH